MSQLLARKFLPVYLFALIISSLNINQARGQTVQEKLGYPPSARLLVIHADDFGGSHSINRAIIQALEHGWVTSASILVPAPWFPEAAQWAKAHPNADLGIHLDLNSEWTTYRWGPVSSNDQVPSLLDSEGYFPLVEDEVAHNAKIPEVQKELQAQIDRARAWGVHLTHLDTHMGTVMHTQQLFEAYKALGHQYDLPVLLERTPSEPVPPGYVIPGRKRSPTPCCRWCPACRLISGSTGTRRLSLRSSPAFISSSCTSPLTTPRCGAPPTSIPTGVRPGASPTWIWSAAPSSGSS